MGSSWADLDAELGLYDKELRAYGQAYFMLHAIKGFHKTVWFRRASIDKIRLDQEAARKRGHSGMLLLFIIEELGYPRLLWFRDEDEERFELLRWLDQGAEEEVRRALKNIALRELYDSGTLRNLKFLMLANKAFQDGRGLKIEMGPGEAGEAHPEGLVMYDAFVMGVDWDEFGFIEFVDLEWDREEPLTDSDDFLDQQRNDDRMDIGPGDAPDTQSGQDRLTPVLIPGPPRGKND